MSLEKLFNPKSIAIIGASEEDGKIGNVISKNILELGYKGDVFFVNPKHEKIFNKKCYKNLAEIFKSESDSSVKKIDLAIIAIPAKFVNQEIKDNAKRIKNYVVISAGFSETGEEGKKQEGELLKIAKKNNLNILGPNCLGFISPHIKLNVSFAGGMPDRGNISFVSQSGALAVALMDKAKKEGLKFSNIVSVGNKMQISETEMLNFLAKDKNTKVIGMYLEGIKNGSEFIKTAREVSLIKPIIILKAGKNEKTQKAISSHTGALAGDDEIISAVFKKAGIIRANNLEEFFSLLSLISFSEKIQNDKVSIITNAGGVGVLTADVFSGKNIKLADFNLETRKKLRKILPPESSIENPIDLLGDAKSDRYENVLKIISKTEESGSIICILTPQKQTPVLEIADKIIDFKKKTKKEIVTIFLGGEKVQDSILKLRQEEICNFDFPDLAVSSIEKYYNWSSQKSLKIKDRNKLINEKRRERVLKIINRAKAEKRQALYFPESAEIMEIYGIKTIQCFDAKNYSNKSLKYPVVIKVDNDKVLHKTDKNGLILDIKNEDELEEAISKIKINFPRSNLIIQPMAKKGMELIIGVKKDQIFGPVVVYGLGGIYTEFLRKVDYLIPPLTLGEVEKSLEEGEVNFLFQGARGQNKYDKEEIAKILLGISFMSLEIPEIKEFDINPLMAYNNGEKSVALDVKIVI